MQPDGKNGNQDKVGWVYYLARFVFFVLFKIYCRIEFHGRNKLNKCLDGRGVILAPNHASYVDPPAVGVGLRHPVTYLAKDYLFKKPVLGTFLRAVGVCPIKTGSAEDLKSIRTLFRLLKDGRWITVFPEGTRSLDGELRKPEPGIGFLALKSRAWVVPVYIEGSFAVCPKGSTVARPRKIRIYFGDPFVPADEPSLASDADAHRAVSEQIMTKIKAIKEDRTKIKNKIIGK